ncbi:cytoplasmic dynein 2 heavy chain 1 [Euwallacea similis]|uniref:cytoplasmic dynein 2 heavy chain 1 n=1 Tax=Euwallacea similis TaxID=1736056 RepID=UPI00344F4923
MTDINENFFKLLQINTLSGEPTIDLYQLLNNIFSPQLQKHYDINIKRKIFTLQTTLKGLILSENIPQESENDSSFMTFIETVDDEIKYWSSQIVSKKDKLARKSGDTFMRLLGLIASELSMIESLPINEVDDLLEKCHNTLDDLWRCNPPFPKDRIKNLMDIIAFDLWKHTVRQFKDADLWLDEYNTILEKLTQSISLCDKWLSTCQQLTGLFWANHEVNPWKDEVYQPLNLGKFIATLREILNIRTVHKQLLRLSSDNEKADLDPQRIFKPFKDLEILSYEDSHDLSKSRKEFEYLLQPAEERVALKLKKQLMTVNTNTRQLIYEFTRYAELINRPVLRKNLRAERQFLLNSLSEYITQIQNQANQESSKVNTRQETSETIREIIFIRQLEAKTEEVVFVTEKLLDDLEGCERVREFVLGILNDLKSQDSELFDAWSSGVISDVNGNKLSLKETDPVVQFSQDKLMKVNYPSRLITLIFEVRQLQAMGYHIPSIIEETSNYAKKFMKYARILEQIANFHNTIGDRMVPSQKPMMLASALELSKLVQEQEVISWGEEKHVEKYVNTLKKCVEKLGQSNDLLTSFHIEILDKIKDLENVSLLREFSRWNEVIKNIRNLVANVENKGFKNMQPWKTEIDVKLSEILEEAYTKNLKKLHLSLEEIRVDLVYRNSTLDFSPNRQNLEQMYEQQLKKYLNIPRNIKGISDNSEDIYNKIIERNGAVLNTLSDKKLELFGQLNSVIQHWQSWLQLEPLNSKKLSTWEHWDLHFRASKTFGQEIAKLPSTEEKVGCFLIGLSRLRSDLESHNRSYWDQLVYSLKDAIAEDVVRLQNYIDPSTAALTKQPVTMEEIGESGFSYNNIIAAYTEMEGVFKELLNKSKTLASWSREQVDSVNRLKGAWERLGSLINNHQHIMARQMETIRTSLGIEQENLLKEIERFEAKWSQINTIHNSFDSNENSIEAVRILYQEVQAKRREWNNVLEKKEALYTHYLNFNLEKPDIFIANEVENALKEEEASWSIFAEFNSAFQNFSSQYWIVFRKKYYELEDFIKFWEDKLSKHMNDIRFVPVVLRDLQMYKELIPTLKYLKGEDFSDKHWNDVFNLLKIPAKPIDQILLKDLLDAHERILDHSKELRNLSKKAASEIVVRQALKDIDQWEVQTKFLLTNHSDSQGKVVVLVKEFKDVLNAIGDHQILLQSLKHSGSVDGYIERASNWENKLENLNVYLNSLAQVQKKWLYLEPIFGSGTLAQEKLRFDRLDRDFRRIMGFIEKDPRVTEICKYPNLKSILQSISEQLSRCQHSLDSFLKEKREKFPRFLFLSDDDLLEIVGQSTKEQVIQSHLKKIFAGTHSVKLNTTSDHIVALSSLQGELVQLANPISIKQPVEDWLGLLVKEMQATLKEKLVACQRESQAPDPLKYPSQILCLSDNISFTLKCEQAISGMTLPALLAKYKTQLNELSSLELGNAKDSDVLEFKLKSLLLDTIHHIRVLEELLEKNVTKVSEWAWQKQLRYYSNSVGDVTVKMAKARMSYSYEYLGNEQKLVRTPLTERCFLTLTQAMYLGLGGNPYGPAGTGKTESVKALGSILGRQVLVFNCDEGIDVNSMERILTGLVKTGAWGCFDEFNRLDETTLSAISMHIHAIQEALRNTRDVVKIGTQEIPVNKHCGIFVTLNPAGAGYGGRNKLPDNLKQLFRPVVMTHPDHEEIARTSLHCDGYRHADVLARKIVEVFEMSRKILSNQQHYDWGLRAIKTVLSGCGMALKKFISSGIKILTQELELGVVVGALKMDIVSKLTFSDTVKFNDILGSIFSDVPEERINDDEVKKAILECYEEMGLVANERQVYKCLEFYKQLDQRMGVAIIGPPSSGKSTILSLVSRAAGKIQRKVKTYPVNPKSMSRHLLLGYTDNLNQWNDGVLTSYSLQVSQETKDNTWSWIICDGDIDPEWVESLNSVLDDNRLMTLPSGWRIHFGENVNFVFETHDLKNASPATISRIGIVYLSSEDINLVDVLKVKLRDFPEKQREFLQSLIKDYFFKAINWVKANGETSLDRSIISIAKTGISQMIHVETKLNFIVTLITSFAMQLKPEFRQEFSELIFEWMDETPPSYTSKLYYDKDKDCLNSYHTDPQISIIEDIRNHGIPLLKTGQMLKNLEVLKLLLEEDKEEHFLLVGNHGSAKRLLIQNLLSDRSDIEIVEINCSSNLMTNYITHKLQQHCISVTTFKGNVLRPRKGKLILYLRNLHLLAPDQWGSNMCIELLSQLIEYKGYFNCKTEFVQVENVVIVGTLIPTHKLSIRFLSKLHSVDIDLPDKEDLTVILVAYLNAILKTYYPTANFPKAKVVKAISTILSIYEKIQDHATLRPQILHPINSHDLVKWCTNLKYYSITNFSQFETSILEIIAYEALRIFGDRLATVDEKNRLKSTIDEAFKTHWEVNQITQSIDETYFVPGTEETLNKFTREAWQAEVERGISQFGKENQNLEVVINHEILLITCAVMRYTVIPQYNMVLIGKSGVGRKTAIKITSALRSKRVIQPASGIHPLFQNELKAAIQYAGVECEDVLLILEDYIFVNEVNTTAINLLISDGDVSDLFSDIEADSLVKGLKEKFDSANFEGDLHQFFANNVKQHLHIFVCLDQDNPNLKEIILKAPSFMQCCGLLWLNQWSPETVKCFPHKLVQMLGEIECMSTSDSFQKIYASFPHAPPCRYTSMIKLYFSIAKQKVSSINANIAKLEGGVSKLTEAKSLVSELKQKAAEQQEKLAEKQSKANAALDMISNTIKGANAHKEEMQVLKQKTEIENVQLVKRKAEIENELSEVEPLIQEARAAVGNIKTESLSEIRSLRAPPEIIRDILEGVLKLMGTQDTSWNSMKTFLAKRGVKEDIRSFDASRIQTENRQAVEKLMLAKKDSFDQKFAKRASVAAAPLAAWVEANVKYSKVVDKIRPLEKEQYKLKENLVNAESQLMELNANLSDVDATVAKLKEQLSQYTKEAAEIEIGLKEVKGTLGSAENLVFKLEDEYQRWQEQLKELSNEMHSLSNNSLMAAAFVTFLSEEEEVKRRRILTEWCLELNNKSDFDFMSFFSSDREQLQWQSEGLPNDRASLENAVVVNMSILSPLLLDPNSTAVRWLRNHYTKSSNSFDHVAFTSSKLNTVLEASIRFGKTLLIEELEEIPPFLFPIIRGDFIVHGERKLVRMLGKVIDCHSDFRLIMSTRNEHIKASAEIAPYICVLNFNVTYSGFIEQLLSAAVTQEKPELESRRKHLLHENEELQEKLHFLQTQLLDYLAGSQGNILSNKGLLQTLNETKSNSVAVTDALQESTKIQNVLRKECEVFLDISSFASRLYFSCKEFERYDILYSLSANAFSKLFLLCLQTTQTQEANADLQRRHLFQTLYNYMSRGMFKKDRLLFALHVVSRMFPNAFPEIEMRVFLENTSYRGLNGPELSELPGWIPEASTIALHNFKNSLGPLYDKCQFGEKNLWSSFMESSQCENEFPRHCQFSEFEKVLTVQILRPDKLLSCIEACCLRVSGLRTVDPGVLSLHYIFNESNCHEPVLLITTSGMDPSNEITDLAKQLGHNFEEISMGEGQEHRALISLEQCKKSGTWLILKNLQLVSYWLPILAENVKQQSGSENFRLWLISESTSKFNAVLAQNSLKVAYEEPQGLGNNIQRIYSSIGEKYENKLSRTSARIFFVFSYVHALLQERRKYIPQGWSQYYEFNHIDMQTGLNLTEELWNIDSTRIQWQFIVGLLNEAIYGGRIECIEDTSILKAYLRIYFKDEVLSHKWRPHGMNVTLPNTGQNKEYGQMAKQLPNKDLPEMFGLPLNIDKAREKIESLKLIQMLKGFYQKQTNSFFSKEVNFKELHPFFSLWKRLNQGHDFVRINLAEHTGNYETSIESFINDEFIRGVSLIQVIHKCFMHLNRILKGAEDPDENDLVLTKEILRNQIPEVWLKLWNGPKNAERYLMELLQKASYLATWKSASSTDFLNIPVKLHLFFNPERFLACSKQDFAKSVVLQQKIIIFLSKHCRKSKIASNELVLQTSWNPSKENTIVLSDLLIEGALIENKLLKACKSNSESINVVPNCYLKWTQKEKLCNDDLIEFALYVNSNREHKIANIQLECDAVSKDQYILSGVAFYLSY